MEVVLKAVKNAALGRLELPVVGPQAGAVEVVTTLVGPYEPDEGMRVSIGRVLAEKARDKCRDQHPVGIADLRIDYSDEGDCEDLQGQQVRTFEADQRCYRLVLLVVPGDA